MTTSASAEYLEMPDRVWTLSDIPDRSTAEQGSVHRLCVRTETEPGGDLINNAVVETLSTGGEVFMLPNDKMPTALGAILRY